MRSISAAQEAVLSSSGIAKSEHMRVQVKDSGGTFRDLTTYPGINLVDSASWRCDIDSVCATAEILLKREVERLSISPFMTDSALNLGFNPAASFAALLALNREIKIEVAIVSADVSPASGDWMNVFHGYIDSIDSASGPQVKVSARDLGSALVDNFIETERAYCMDDTTNLSGMRVWQPSTAYAQDEFILPATRGTHTDGTGATVNDSGKDKYYKCTTAGTSGTTEPTWPSSSTVADNTAVHTYEAATSPDGVNIDDVLDALLDDNGSSETVTVVGSPSWLVQPYLQQRQSLMEAMRTIAEQLGWDLRYKWNVAAGAWKLTLYEPDRSDTTEDRTFYSADYESLTRLAIDNTAIRNAVRVVYSDPADLMADGITPKRKVVDVTDSTSITAYGRRFMEIAEADSSQINSSTRATALANAALSDLKDPTAEAELVLAYGFPWVELCDLYQIDANYRHIDVAQKLAVYGFNHEASNGRIKTTLQLRAKPALQYMKWHGKASVAKKIHDVTEFQAPLGVNAAVTPIVGGARLDVSLEASMKAHELEFEHHISTSSSFTPAAATLCEVSRALSLEVTNLIPGTTYYHRVIPRTRNLQRPIRGQPSKEISFAAGRASAGHILSRLDTSRKPLNGGFETQIDSDGLPDFWQKANATLSVETDANGFSGGKYVGLSPTGLADAQLYSAVFEVKASTRYRMGITHKETVEFDYINLALREYGVTATEDSISTGYIGSSYFTLNYSAAWLAESGIITTSADARFGRMFLYAYYADTETVYVDNLFIEEYPEDWIAPSLQNSWVDNGGGTNAAGYRRSLDGSQVFIQGTIKDGTATAGTELFTLPAGYRPAGIVFFPTICSGSNLAEIKITAAGVVSIQAGNNTLLSLDGISFTTF